MEIIHKQDRTVNSAKALVNRGERQCLNAQCLSALYSLAERLKQNGVSISGGEDQKGGYVIHFINGEALWQYLPQIETAVMQNDDLAFITLFNCP